jgi:hypothetical protein
VAAINGFDSYGHYLRAQLIVNLCSTYSTSNSSACTANFQKPVTRSGPSGSDDSIRSPRLVREDRVLRGESVETVLGKNGADGGDGASKTSKKSGDAIALPPALLPGDSSGAQSTPAGKPQAQAPAAAAQPGSRDDPAGALLDYLLGGGA